MLLPYIHIFPRQMTLHGRSVTDILESCNPSSTNSSDCGSVWTTLAHIPVEYSSLATLRGLVLAATVVTKRQEPICCYDVAPTLGVALGRAHFWWWWEGGTGMHAHPFLGCHPLLVLLWVAPTHSWGHTGHCWAKTM